MVTAKNSFEVADYGGNEALIVKEWSSACEDQLKARQRPVVLNQARGWKPTSISFLAELEIEQLAILAHVPVPGLDTVVRIRGLRKLSLDCEATKAVPLDKLAALDSCWLAWSEHYSSIMQHPSLAVLGIADYPHKDLQKVGGLRFLEELRLKSGGLASVSGIGGVADKLRVLELGGLKSLQDLDEVADLRELTRLSLDGCKRIQRIDALRTLTSLVSLDISDMGSLESLDSIRGMSSLEEVFMLESTDIMDGDLSPLATLPKLRKAVFQERSHYSHMCLLGMVRPIRKPWKRST